eukprot:706956-Amphidinium_carterae.1
MQLAAGHTLRQHCWHGDDLFHNLITTRKFDLQGSQVAALCPQGSPEGDMNFALGKHCQAQAKPKANALIRSSSFCKKTPLKKSVSLYHPVELQIHLRFSLQKTMRPEAPGRP